MNRQLGFIVSILLSISMFIGCSSEVSRSDKVNIPENEVLTDENVKITMFGYWKEGVSENYSEFFDIINEKFPEIDIEYEGFPGGKEAYTDELYRRIDHGKQADIILAYNTSLWDSGKIMNLTNQEFSGRYSISIMNKLSNDGNVYFIPGIGGINCYIYNKTWLNETGLGEPKNFEEMMSVLKAVANNSHDPFMIPYNRTESYMIKMIASTDYFSKPEGQMWLKKYNEGTAKMKDNKEWQRIWRKIKYMTDHLYITESDLDHAEGRRFIEIRDGFAFMTAANAGAMNLESSENEFGVLPFLGDKEENNCFFAEPDYYFGLNADLSNSENSKKKEACLKIMDFISSEEGQNSILTGEKVGTSYVNGIDLELNQKYDSLKNQISSNQFSEIPMFTRGVEEVLGKVTAEVIKGKMTVEEAMEACDKQNSSYVESIEEDDKINEIIGKSAKDYHWTYIDSRTKELEMTNIVVDSIRESAGTEIAIELGTAVRGEFFEGNITQKDIESVIRLDRDIYTIDVTGQQIFDIIKEGVISYSNSWFTAVSGLKYKYQMADESEKNGKLIELTLSDGTPLNMAKTYHIAVTSNQMTKINGVFSFYDLPAEKMGITLREALINYVTEREVISSELEGRIEVLMN